MKLKRLDIDNEGPTKIVAPHIHCLRVRHSHRKCSLVDVSSLTEAYLNIYYSNCYYFKADFAQIYVLSMLQKLQNVKNLAFGAAFLQMLSLAEFCDIPFPMLKVEVLTLETMIVPSFIPGIAKLLQNSPGVKFLKLDLVNSKMISDWDLNYYLDLKGLDQNQCWIPKDLDFSTSLEPKLMTSFMEFLLENTREDNTSQYNW
ncbi:PREDICTED: F-box/LRR-repeat protein At5g02910-like [Camelina sativa]|uniref:F-box/LRR-repeat protein At5g02910-like n=1 Tax=Camelina sativa TaxID=90675 RepID=A0ABM0TBN2_CAMSA|nr:PREDICTED: F-box/LRR-repeat protein At5g02910-like [Camelina sativa]